jgi:CDP-diacylglycerol--serine O-phosphatidyltransferase
MSPVRRLVPVGLTFLSLLCGMGAIALAVDGEVGYAGGLILAGYIIDALDGEVARRLSATSDFGKQLDSISDVVIFGAAGAVLVREHTRGELAGWLVWVFGLAYVAAGAYRLARFNLNSRESKPRETLGLTISTSGALVTLSVLSDRVYAGELFPPGYFLLLLCVAAVLMTSRVRFPELRVFFVNRWWSMAMVGGFLAFSILASLQVVGLALAAGYVAFGLIRAGLRIF